MNISQVRSFFEVLNTNNFSEAAERLYTTQSTVSKNISALEKEMGFLLFERRGRKVFLTPAGKKMIRVFGEYIYAHNEVERVADEIRKTGQSVNKTIRIGMVPSVEKLDIIPRINQYAEQQEQMDIVIEIADEQPILLELQSDYYDLVFCSDLFLDDRNYVQQKFSDNRFMLIMSDNHPLAQKEEVRLADLEQENLILLHPESMLRNLCVNACEAAGFYPDVTISTSRIDLALEFVKSSRCIYMGVELEADKRLPEGFCVKTLTDSPTFHYVFAWNRFHPCKDKLRALAQYLT